MRDLCHLCNNQENGLLNRSLYRQKTISKRIDFCGLFELLDYFLLDSEIGWLDVSTTVTSRNDFCNSSLVSDSNFLNKTFQWDIVKLFKIKNRCWWSGYVLKFLQRHIPPFVNPTKCLTMSSKKYIAKEMFVKKIFDSGSHQPKLMICVCFKSKQKNEEKIFGIWKWKELLLSQTQWQVCKCRELEHVFSV